MEVMSNEEKRQQRQRTRFINKSTYVSVKYLRRLSELKGMPENAKYFMNILENVFANMNDVYKEEGTKTVGTYCVMVPSELIYAAGAIPIKSCSGSYTAFNVGDEVAPRDACPVIKSIIGFQESNCMPVYNNCDLMVVPTTCDCKKKLGYLLKEYKDVLTLHIPTSKKDDESIEYYMKDLFNLKEKLEDITGQRITASRLRSSIEMIAETQYEISRFYELKKENPSVIKGSHALAIMNSYSYDRADRWGRALKLLNDELEMNLERGKTVSKSKNPRIMITGSPIVFPNIKIPLLIEEMGGILVADETCMGERSMYDPVVVVDNSFNGMMRALARRYVLPCSCPTFVDNKQRIYKIKQMIKENQVEGVVYHVLRGCLVYDYEYSILEEALSEMGIPIIRLESDYNEEDIEQLRIRIEAFIEIIKFKK